MEITRVFKILGLIGLLLALTGIVGPFFFPLPAWLISSLEGIALLCLLGYLIVHYQSVKTFSTRRSTRLGFTSIFSLLLAVGVVILVNVLAARHAPQLDLSETHAFTITNQSYQVLNTLDRDVTVTVFAHEGSPQFANYRDLLRTYTAATPRLSVTFVDPEREPAVAQKYHVTRMDTAVFESGAQKIYLTEPSEQEMTNALLRVSRDRKKRIVFLKGHGEKSLFDQERTGLSRSKDALEKQGYAIQSLSFTEEELPADTTVLVVASPARSISDHEQRLIQDYLTKGGRLLLLLDPRTGQGLHTLMEGLGIRLGRGILVDERDHLGRGSLTALLIRTFTAHDITEDFTIPILLPVSRYLEFDPGQGSPWTFTPLAQTSPKSWAETDLSNRVPTFDPHQDVKGPFTVAAALTPKTPDAKTGHNPAVVIIGNSAFASNGYLNYPGNTDFFLKTVAWLAGEGALVSIAPREPAFRPFVPNPSQEQALLFFQVLLLPAFTLFMGFSVWRKRHRL